MTSAVLQTAAPDALGSRLPGSRSLRLRRNKPHLVCLGDLTLDIVVRSQAPVEAGTDVPATISFRAGGSAANSARSFARLGGAAVFIGAIGDDKLGARLTASLRGDGVTVHAVRQRGLSARLLALIDAVGERSFVTDRGVADSLLPRAVKASWLTRADALHLPAYSLLNAPLADAAFEAASRVRARGRLVSVDLASHRPLLAAGRRGATDLIRRAAPDVLFANAREAAALVGAGRAAARRLLDLSPVVVIKFGGQGCRVLSRDAVDFDLATKTLAVTDTTGAGDAFDAGFLYSLILGGHLAGGVASAAVLRRAAVAGHRSATRLLTSARAELVL
jgi:sugar/nucleoside kinase (ribokinase family)